MFKFILFLLFIIIIDFTSKILAHITCYVARRTNKQICACWDCKKPCDLHKWNKGADKDE